LTQSNISLMLKAIKQVSQDTFCRTSPMHLFNSLPSARAEGEFNSCLDPDRVGDCFYAEFGSYSS